MVACEFENISDKYQPYIHGHKTPDHRLKNPLENELNTRN